jgi:hypothetical protein
VKLTVLLAVVALAAPLLAQEIPLSSDTEDPGCIAEHAQSRIAAFLQLTPEQLDEWNLLIEDRQLAAEPLWTAIAQVQQDIEDLLNNPDPDPTELGDLVIMRHELGLQLAEVQRIYVEGFVDLLSDDQHGQYHFIRQAERAQPLIPAFRVMDLLPPHWR